MIKVVLPKGRLFKEVVKLLGEAGYTLKGTERSYRPAINDPEIEVKIMKARNIPKLVELGSHDLGITGYDWVVENKADVAELLDLGYGRVRLVAAVPKNGCKSIQGLKGKKVVAASEYRSITEQYLEENGIEYEFIQSFGATEVFPPEDADIIIENIETGETLKQNNLAVIGTLMESSARLIANKESLEDGRKKKKIEDITMLINSALIARERVFLEMNVSEEKLEAVCKLLPAMKSPTISKLYSDEGYAIKAAVKKNDVPALIPKLKQAGATDILEFELRRVVA
ncbi:MAG: ATP phosphoribosyltransferase [Candidatus Diapherotrites archaeon]|nr:ATP phosphoribosyltransferase [Candidatus Diapherotrites archaeon]